MDSISSQSIYIIGIIDDDVAEMGKTITLLRTWRDHRSSDPPSVPKFETCAGIDLQTLRANFEKLHQELRDKGFQGIMTIFAILIDKIRRPTVDGPKDDEWGGGVAEEIDNVIKHGTGPFELSAKGAKKVYYSDSHIEADIGKRLCTEKRFDIAFRKKEDSDALCSWLGELMRTQKAGRLGDIYVQSVVSALDDLERWRNRRLKQKNDGNAEPPDEFKIRMHDGTYTKQQILQNDDLIARFATLRVFNPHSVVHD